MTLKTLTNSTKRSFVVADSSPLIALAILDLLTQLPELLGDIWVPETVLNECLAKQGSPGFAEIQQASNDKILKVHPDFPESDQQIIFLSRLLDPGEAQAITLADKYKATLLIDEKSGRSTAKTLGVQVTGSLAVLQKAKKMGVIPSVKEAVVKLQQHNYRYSDRLIAHVLDKAGE